MAKEKTVLVTNGNNDHRGTTRATTEAGYIRAAKQIWPYAGMTRVKIRVFDFEEEAKGNDPIIFETMKDLMI